MITDDNQRFTEGRESRRPAGELIKTAAFDVVKATLAAPATAFVRKHHYSRTHSAPAHPFELYCRGTLVGVALFGPPASMNAHRFVFPTLTKDEAVTLGRLVLLDEVPGNGESWFIARCFELLRADGIVAVESCADPQPRATVDGRLVFKGHLGTVYCATNGHYVGRTNDSTLRLFPDGTVFSNKSSGKVVRTEQGAAYSAGQLEAWGAERLQAGEDPKVWLRYWRSKLTRKMRHRGNHRYIWCLDRRRRREVLAKPALPYPKSEEWLAARAA